MTTPADPAFMIYGAYGYTGELIAREAVAVGLSPTLAGRDEARLGTLAAELGVPHVAFATSDSTAMRAAFKDQALIINCAGPFVETWDAVTDACIETGTHYIDITGESDVLAGCATKDAAAREAGVTLMPGCGFDVVPTDCMAAMLVQRLPDANRIELAFKGMGQASRGTARTAAPHLARAPLVRRKGQLTEYDGPVFTNVDFGQGPEKVAVISWGDIVTAWHTTGVPDITVSMQLAPDMEKLLSLPAFLRRLLVSPLGRPLMNAQLNRMPAGPDEDARRKGGCIVWGCATNPAGTAVDLRMTTMEGYRLTSKTAPRIATAILSGQVAPGFQTPAKAMGADFILEFEGSALLG